MSRVLGVDGWRRGWVGALVDEDGIRWRTFTTAAEVVREPADLTAIDIPVGLPDSGRRRCDVEARRLLPGAASSVFAAPVRPVLGCETYADALAMLRRLGGPSMSAQAFGLVTKVRDVDEVMTPALQQRVVEVHPEIAFRRAAGVPQLPGKRSAEGVGRRIAALSGVLGDVVGALAHAPAAVPVDDALDALGCAWAAGRVLAGDAHALGGGERDGRGLLMQIVVPGAGCRTVPGVPDGSELQ